MIKLIEDTKKMGMFDLMHNSFFIKDKEVYYRDFEREISARDLAKELYEKHTSVDTMNMNNEYLDETLMDHGQYGTDHIEGIISMFYSVLCGAAGVREELKEKSELLEAIKLAEESGHGYYLCNENWFVVIDGLNVDEDLKMIDWYKEQRKEEKSDK